MKEKKKRIAPRKPEVPPVKASKGLSAWLVKNIIAALVVGFLVYQLVEKQAGYHFVSNMLSNNYTLITTHPNLSLDERYQTRMGFTYRYLKLLRESSPENAVILFPEEEDFFPPDVESPFKREGTKKMAAIRFLYPRKLVLPSEMQANRYADSITHVAIVNGRGYERLHYSFPDPGNYPHNLLPINP